MAIALAPEELLPQPIAISPLLLLAAVAVLHSLVSIEPVPVAASDCILNPAATKPRHIVLNFIAVDASDVILAPERTTPFDDFPRLLAYSATATKQPKERFQMTL